MRQPSEFLAWAVLSGLVAVVGCVTRPASSAVYLPPTDECVLQTEPVFAGSMPAAAPQMTIVIADRVDSHDAPRPHTDAERVLFRQLYETLVRVDCRGRVTPGLAASWREEASGRRWTFTLRADARFWNGAPVTAGDVRASWLGAGLAGGSPLVPESVTAVDERTLTLSLNRAVNGPGWLADPDLAVARPSASNPWPEGSGPLQLVSDSGVAGATSQVVTVTSRLSAGLRETRFRWIVGGDARDALDQGIDLLITDDPSVLEYAAPDPRYVTLPLPWRRTYVLLGEVGYGSQIGSIDAREALARDAVRVEARDARPPFWWQERAACELGTEGTVRSNQVSARIVYPRDDPVARGLAGRLVALLGGSGGASALVAVGLEPSDFSAALRGGADRYLMGLPRSVLDPCGALDALVRRAPWFNEGEEGSLHPLVDTRLHAIVRRGLPGIAIDWDGTPLLVSP